MSDNSQNESDQLTLLDVLGFPSDQMLFSFQSKSLIYSLGSNIIYYNLATNSTNSNIKKTVAKNWNGWKVRCVVTDTNGNVAISNTATITVSDIISIIEQPASVSVPAGETVTFNITAKSSNGKALTYQWQYQGTASAKWNNFLNAANTEITKTATQNWNGWKIRCIIKDEDGSIIPSDAAVITICDAISITEQPSSVAAIAGADISFKISAESNINVITHSNITVIFPRLINRDRTCIQLIRNSKTIIARRCYI